ncbi:hypothetical protein P3F83_12040 [Mycobacteroides immunogenum]|uniref:hypothetical protein n=1 Tax=Mycobacteroides immunogenum TaxID=83262 RepID=UPI0025B78E70|nr:hypothetical protein [Mycobacteroides immunogenum]WJR36702.1 hypothetical protein P3F83_12040 [Mycobacteroides immunogenum]
MDLDLKPTRGPILWETRTDGPFPGLTTHAYLWTRPTGNVLFHSPATESSGHSRGPGPDRRKSDD